MLGEMTAVVAPVVVRRHHAMWDEEPGRQGTSAIDSRCAGGEAVFRVVTVTYGGNAETSTSGNKRSARSFERIIESDVGVMTFG